MKLRNLIGMTLEKTVLVEGGKTENFDIFRGLR